MTTPENRENSQIDPISNTFRLADNAKYVMSENHFWRLEDTFDLPGVASVKVGLRELPNPRILISTIKASQIQAPFSVLLFNPKVFLSSIYPERTYRLGFEEGAFGIEVRDYDQNVTRSSILAYRPSLDEISSFNVDTLQFPNRNSTVSDFYVSFVQNLRLLGRARQNDAIIGEVLLPVLANLSSQKST